MGIETRRFFFILAGLTAIGAVMRLYGISHQPPFTDEVQMASTATGYMQGGQTLPTMPHHPNLRNIMIYWSMHLFGNGSIGLRFFSLTLGILAIPFLGLLVRQVTGRTVAGGLAAFFLAADPLHITFSRQAIQETHVVFFSLLGVVLIQAFLQRRRHGGGIALRDLSLLPLAGIIFGLGVASKYQALFPLLVCLGVIVYTTLRNRDATLTALAVLSLTVVPLIVLMLTDAPWFGRGYGLEDWLFMRRAVFERMSGKYVPALMEMNIDRSAWAWFVNPILGYASFSMSEGKRVLAVGMGNPFVMMLVLPSILYVLRRRDLRKQGALLLALFWITYVPFLLTSRAIFFLTALAVTPYAFGLLGVVLDDFAWRTRRKALYAYCAVVLAVTVLLLPLCMGKTLDYRYSEMLVERFNPHPDAVFPPTR